MLDGSGRLAIVHLGWPEKPEAHVDLPSTQIVRDWKKFVDEIMVTDNAEWT